MQTAEGVTESAVQRWRWFLANTTVCMDDAARVEFVRRLLEDKARREPRILSFVNAHAANLAWENSPFWEDISASDFIVRDGIGMKLLMKACGVEPGINLNGTDFIPSLLDEVGSSHTIAIYGTGEPWLGRGAKVVRGMGFATVTTATGFFPDSWYLERAKQDDADLIVLGMGMPKQERVARLLRNGLAGRDVLIVNGGAVVDFLAGRFPRAPRWMRISGLEWLYRLGREPRRLWRRYVLGNGKFMLRIISFCYARRVKG